jgi:hypothetical protein
MINYHIIWRINAINNIYLPLNKYMLKGKYIFFYFYKKNKDIYFLNKVCKKGNLDILKDIIYYHNNIELFILPIKISIYFHHFNIFIFIIEHLKKCKKKEKIKVIYNEIIIFCLSMQSKKYLIHLLKIFKNDNYIIDPMIKNIIIIWALNNNYKDILKIIDYKKK